VISILLGIVFVLVSLWLSVPISWGPQWTNEVLTFLKGFLPVMLAFFGLLFVVAGSMVLKDRLLAKKEEKRENMQI